MHFQLKKTIAHVTVLTALIPVAACTGGQIKTQRNPELATQQVTSLRDPDLAPKRGQYAYDVVESRVVHTTVTGECVKTIYWTPDGATQECQPGMFGKASAPVPQAALAPAPKPVPQPAPQQAPQPAPTVVEYEAMQYAEAPAPVPAEAPMQDFYAPGDAPDLVPVPPVSGEAGPDDRISEPKAFEEETVVAEEEVIAAPEEGIVARREYYEEEEGVQKDDGIVGQSQYHEEEESVQKDDGIVGQSQYYEEEESVQKDDGIVGQSQYYEEEESVQKDDGIVGQSQYYEEEESVQKDDGIVGQSQYHEEEESVTDDGIVARSEYYEEEGKQPEDLISEPKAAEESTVDAAEQEQAAAPAVAAAEQEQPAAPAVAAAEQEQPAAPVVAAAEQEQVAAPAEAAAPTPAPQPAAAPQPTPVMLPLTITLEAEPWFDFDRYTVRSDSRDKLDKLVSELSGVEYDQIVVVGHADPIGTVEYNQVLSERRARAVKNYLVGKGVPADRIRAEGRGEFDLPFDPALCKGQKGKKYVSCLQPDRSVEVTVTGTKPQQ